MFSVHINRGNFLTKNSLLHSSKKHRNKVGMTKTQETTLLKNSDGLHSGFQCNALASLLHLLHTQQSELGMQVHCIGGQRGGQHCSIV